MADNDTVIALLAPQDGASTIDPDGAVELFYGHCSPDAAAAAIARLGPQRMANLGEAVTRAPWRSVPSTYAICTDDQAVHPGLQQILTARASASVSWPTDHSPFLSCPDAVVDLVATIAHDAT